MVQKEPLVLPTTCCSWVLFLQEASGLNLLRCGVKASFRFSDYH